MHNTTRNQFYPTTSLNLHVLSCKRYSCKKTKCANSKCLWLCLTIDKIYQKL